MSDRILKRLIVLCALLFPLVAMAQDEALLGRMLSYPDSVRQVYGVRTNDTLTTNVYSKYHIRVLRRNVTMLTVPNMFHIAHGPQRDFFGEMYSSVRHTERAEVSSLRQVHVSTVRHRRSTLAMARHYATPHIYTVTMVADHLLSPFHAANRHFYRYTTRNVDSTLAVVGFRPKLQNTQLVTGEATVVRSTGRLLGARIEGEFDMMTFVLELTMGGAGRQSLEIESCEADVLLLFLGNKIRAGFTSVYHLPETLPPTLIDVDSLPLMERLRPVPLAPDEVYPVAVADTDTLAGTEAAEQEDTALKEAADAVWDAIQDNMLNPIRTDFGDAEQHQLRVGPIFNPLYFDYSKSRGLTYRLRMDFQYRLGANSRLLWEMDAGYAFKQRQVYFDMPLTWQFNVRHGGYLRLDLANGSHISSSDVLERVKAFHPGDTIDFDGMNLDYFRNLTVGLKAGYSLSPTVDALVGLNYYRRSAVNAYMLSQMGEPTVYRTFAPMLELTWRPSGRRGPVLTAAYEHGVPHMLGGSVRYSRWEFDGAYVMSLPCTRRLSLRGGLGFYLSKGNERYFLDYAYFRRNNIPGGWRDDYTGEFELLHSDWYNASDYYFRANTTYESPMLLFNRLPWVGRLVERERIYLSALAVRNYFPFVEFGYGLTNRLCSLTTFFGFSPHGYEGFGFRFGFELFNDW